MSKAPFFDGNNLPRSKYTAEKDILLIYSNEDPCNSSCCSESQREAALLLGQFAATDSDCKVNIDFSFLTKIYT